jgi:hypothetical protein
MKMKKGSGEQEGVRRGNTGDNDAHNQGVGLYYAHQMQPMPQSMQQAPYGYHHIDPQWVAHNHMYAQQFYHHQQMYG